jgi:GrpB-like predicted nucleotidyltransferase (UPF0157 family)
MVDPVSHVIEVVPYDPRWPKAFEEEAKKLAGALGKNCVTLYHIGSTAVPGLAAKPIIDILIVVKDIFEVDKKAKELEKLGYIAKGENGIPFRRHFHKGDFIRTHNIHIYEEGSAEIDSHLYFRDYLREQDEKAEEYAKLKFDLAKKHPHGVIAYCEGKEGFIHKILKNMPFPKLRLVVALLQSEWEAVATFCKDRPLIKEGHTHMLLFLGVEAIGYADIVDRSIEFCTIKEGYEEHLEEFNKMLSRWLIRP